MAANTISNLTAAFPNFIENCGPYAESLFQLMIKVRAILSPAIKDAEKGTSSTHGFETFFRDSTVSPYVRNILGKIADLAELKNLLPNPWIPSSPRFTCVKPETVTEYPFIMIDPWLNCLHNVGTFALYALGTKYIFLCPSFWLAPSAPTSPNCPDVANNMFREIGNTLASYQVYMLIHEMVHFYLREYTLGPLSIPPEAYLLNDCVALNAYTGKLNPQNYQYYVASKCHQYTFAKGRT